MRPVNLIVIHCADIPNGRVLTEYSAGNPRYADPAQVIDRWHSEFGWRRQPAWLQKQNWRLTSIGYHFVIGINGALYTGRHLDEIGAHALQYNPHSVGVCLLGRDAYTHDQWSRLRVLLDDLVKRYPGAQIAGHRDLKGMARTCPGFDVQAWIKNGRTPFPQHIHPTAN